MACTPYRPSDKVRLDLGHRADTHLKRVYPIIRPGAFAIDGNQHFLTSCGFTELPRSGAIFREFEDACVQEGRDEFTTVFIVFTFPAL